MSDIRNASTRVTPRSRMECCRGSLCEDQSFRLDTRTVYSIRPSFASHFFREKRNYCCSLSYGENKSVFPTLILFILLFLFIYQSGRYKLPTVTQTNTVKNEKIFATYFIIHTLKWQKYSLKNCPQLNTTLHLFKRWITLASHNMQPFLSCNARVSSLSLGRSVAWREKNGCVGD